MVETLSATTPNAAVTIAQTSLFRLLYRHFESFAFPNSIDAFEIDLPAFLVEQPSNHAVAVARKLSNQLKNPTNKPLLVFFL